MAARAGLVSVGVLDVDIDRIWFRRGSRRRRSRLLCRLSLLGGRFRDLLALRASPPPARPRRCGAALAFRCLLGFSGGEGASSAWAGSPPSHGIGGDRLRWGRWRRLDLYASRAFRGFARRRCPQELPNQEAGVQEDNDRKNHHEPLQRTGVRGRGPHHDGCTVAEDSGDAPVDVRPVPASRL